MKKSNKYFTVTDAKSYFSEALKSDFLQKVIETFATRILLILLGLATTVIVTRILGPEGRGMYTVAVAIGAIGVQFGNFGFHASNTYYVAKDQNYLPKLLANSLVISFVIGTLGAVLLWCFFSIFPEFSPVSGNLLIMSLIWIPLGLSYLLLQNLLIGIQEMRSYNLIEIVSKLLGIGLTVQLIWLNVVNVETIFIVGLVVLIVGDVWALIKLKDYLTYFPRPSLKLFKKSIGYGYKAYFAAFFSFMVLKTDLLMVQYFKGPEQAGYYSIASSMGSMLMMIPEVIGMILFPKLAAIKNNSQRVKLTISSAFLSGFAMSLVLFLLWFIGEDLIVLLFGDRFIHSFQPFIILCIGIFLFSVEVMLRRYLNSDSKGYRNETVYIWGGGMVINIVLNYLVVPVYGINGAAFVTSISFLFVFIAVIFLFLKDISTVSSIS